MLSARHSFISKNIIDRFDIPHIIFSKNSQQFNNKNFKEFSSSYEIRIIFATPDHPQSIEQVEAAKKVIKHCLNTIIEALKSGSPQKLPYVLWVYKTTSRIATGKALFLLAYGTEVVVPRDGKNIHKSGTRIRIRKV